MVALLNAACLFFSDFALGTPRSLLDAPAFLACVAAALTSLIGKARHVCFVALATFSLVPLFVGCLWMLLFLLLE